MPRKLKWLAAFALVFVLAFGLVGTAFASSDNGQGQPGRYIVTLDTAVNEAAEAYIEKLGGVIIKTLTLVNSYVVLIPGAAVNGLRGIPGVICCVEDGRVWAIDAELDDSWGVKRIGAGVVHAYNKGTGIKVVIIDTGIDYTHADLDDNCVDLDNNGIIDGWDFVNSDADPMDDNGHGTHCAGIVAAEDNEAGVVGVAPEASLYAVKVLNSSGSGYVSDVVAGIEWSINNGMQVISMSLGTSTDYQVLQDACDAAYAAGIVVVAAAGNEGNPPGRGDNVLYPAKYSSVIAVGATDQGDERARWSSTGTDLELVAPGVDINSTLLGGTYGEKSGTSMSCPHVAGTAALVIAGEGLTNVQVRIRLQQTADDLGEAGFDTKYGYGLVDAEAAVAAPPAPNNPPVADDKSVMTDEDTPVGITLSGSDADGDPLAFSIVTGPASGALGDITGYSTTEGITTATVEYTPAANFNGSDSFTYKANDGIADSDPATVFITVTAVNDAPVADDKAVSTQKNTLVTIILSGSDVDGDSLTFSLMDGPAHGSLGTVISTSETTATVEYTPDANYEGLDSFTYKANDGIADSNIATVTITVAEAAMAYVDITLTPTVISRGPWLWAKVEASVSISDSTTSPINGATVEGCWSGAYSSDVSGVTDGGTVSFETPYVKGGGTFTFTVLSVTKDGITYVLEPPQPEATITVP